MSAPQTRDRSRAPLALRWRPTCTRDPVHESLHPRCIRRSRVVSERTLQESRLLSATLWLQSPPCPSGRRRRCWTHEESHPQRFLAFWFAPPVRALSRTTRRRSSSRFAVRQVPWSEECLAHRETCNGCILERGTVRGYANRAVSAMRSCLNLTLVESHRSACSTSGTPPGRQREGQLGGLSGGPISDPLRVGCRLSCGAKCSADYWQDRPGCVRTARPAVLVAPARRRTAPTGHATDPSSRLLPEIRCRIGPCSGRPRPRPRTVRASRRPSG